MAIGTVRILNKHKDKYTIDDVYIGRGSILGNPFTHKDLGSTKAEVKVETRDEAIEKYREYMIHMIKTDLKFREAIVDLIHKLARGEDVKLVCFCKPKSCHGDVIKEIVEKYAKNVRIAIDTHQ